MVNAMAALVAWQGGDPTVRYGSLLLHPGMGVLPGVRVRIWQMTTPGGPVAACVTEDGGLNRAPETVRKALERWSRGDFDPVTPGGVPPAEQSGS